jgi:hypothetical protein
MNLYLFAKDVKKSVCSRFMMIYTQNNVPECGLKVWSHNFSENWSVCRHSSAFISAVSQLCCREGKGNERSGHRQQNFAKLAVEGRVQIHVSLNYTFARVDKA